MDSIIRDYDSKDYGVLTTRVYMWDLVVCTHGRR